MKQNRAIEIMMAVALLIAGIFLLVPTRQVGDPQKLVEMLNANFTNQDAQNRADIYKANLTPALQTKLRRAEQGYCKGDYDFLNGMPCPTDIEPLACGTGVGQMHAFIRTGDGKYEAHYAASERVPAATITYRMVEKDGRLLLDGAKCVTQVNDEQFW